MQEGDIRVILSHSDGRIHEAKGGGKDNVVPGLGQTADGALCVRTFVDVLYIGGVHLVTKMLFDRQATLVMLVAPAVIPDGTHIDETDFGGVFRHGGPRQSNGDGKQQAAFKAH